jgi:membrane-associated phospholipid phosphatase
MPPDRMAEECVLGVFGIDWVLWLQTHTAALDPVWRALSLLGTEEFLLPLGIILYWCVDYSIGLRLGLILATGGALGGALKLAFHSPRPYWTDLRVEPLAGEITYGMPSSHSITAWSVFPWLSRKARRFGWIGGIALAVGVMASRLYLGVHSPADVFAGMAIGIAVWLLVAAGIRRGAPILARAGWIGQCAAAAAVSGLLLAIQAGALGALRTVVDPPEWAANAARVNAIDPRNPAELISMAGLILGLGAGLALQRRWARFDAGGPLGKRMLRFLLGLAVLLVIWRGLPILWNEYAQPISLVLRYVRYGLVGLWAAFLAPWCFRKLGLASAPPRRTG